MWLVLKAEPCRLYFGLWSSGCPAPLKVDQLHPLAVRMRPSGFVLWRERFHLVLPSRADGSQRFPRRRCHPPRDGVRKGAALGTCTLPAHRCWGWSRHSPSSAPICTSHSHVCGTLCSPVAAWKADGGGERASTGWAPWASSTPRYRWLFPSPPWGHSCC